MIDFLGEFGLLKKGKGWESGYLEGSARGLLGQPGAELLVLQKPASVFAAQASDHPLHLELEGQKAERSLPRRRSWLSSKSKAFPRHPWDWFLAVECQNPSGDQVAVTWRTVTRVETFEVVLPRHCPCLECPAVGEKWENKERFRERGRGEGQRELKFIYH